MSQILCRICEQTDELVNILLPASQWLIEKYISFANVTVSKKENKNFETIY